MTTKNSTERDRNSLRALGHGDVVDLAEGRLPEWLPCEEADVPADAAWTSQRLLTGPAGQYVSSDPDYSYSSRGPGAPVYRRSTRPWSTPVRYWVHSGGMIRATWPIRDRIVAAAQAECARLLAAAAAGCLEASE